MKRAVDLDGTLAFYENFEGPTIIGEPIPVMAERVKKWLAAGDTVDVFTARVHPSHGVPDCLNARKAVQDWFCLHFGCVPKVTCQKDPEWDDYFDDKAVTVEKNTGKILTMGYSEVETVTDGIGGFICGDG